MTDLSANDITGRTGLICILGSPVAHSISPAMHNCAFRSLGLDYVYLAFDVGRDGLRAAVDGLRAVGARGWNVTMPDKNLMAEYCDRLSPASQLTGAVNTVVNDDGVLTGYTTDGIGYMEAARQAGFELGGKTMTVLGAGGAAAAVVTQAALDGLRQIRVFNRVSGSSGSYQRMQKLAASIEAVSSCRVSVQDLADERALADSIGSSDILVNTTSVGMTPNEDACLIKDRDLLRKDLIVSDIIYSPDRTRLLEMAAGSGCRVFNGLYMLLYQGAASFRLWTGCDMPTELIKEKCFRR